MEENIFNGAKFGDKFLTRDGRVAIYCNTCLNDHHYVLIEGETACLSVLSNGSCVSNAFDSPDDIVSRYQEPISETKFDRVDYAIEILQAWKKGTPIEYYHESSKVWLPFTSPDKSGIISALSDFELRIKPNHLTIK